MKNFSKNKISKNDESFSWLWLVIIVLGIGYWATQGGTQQTSDSVAVEVKSPSVEATQPTQLNKQTRSEPPTKSTPAVDPSTSFELKQKCAQYRTAIENKIKIPYRSPDYPTRLLDEIFYSPVENSCLYSTLTTSGSSATSSTTATYAIRDYLQNTLLFYDSWTFPFGSEADVVANPVYYQFVAKKNRLQGS